MSSQDGAGIPLVHAPDGLGYRLLELPAELVALLEGDNPPTLTITSSDTAALLKTPDKTYSLRQKNTSNSLMLLAPASDRPSPGQMPAPSLRAIATVHETIELVAEGGSDVTAPALAARGKWHELFGQRR